jgi:hypothetical protein
MAEKVIGFKIQIEGLAGTIETATQLKRQIAEINAELKKTADVDEIKKLEKKLVDLKAAQSLVNDVTREQVKLRKEEIAGIDKSQGAYRKLSKELNDQRNRYKDLAAAEQESSQEAQDLLVSINALDKKLKGIDATVGQFQRNVGGYTEALSQFFPKLGGTIGNVTGLVGDLSSGFAQLGQSTGVANIGLGAVGLGLAAFEGISNILADIKQSVKEVTDLKIAFENFGFAGEQLDNVAAKAQSLGEVFEENSAQVAIAANTISKEFGIPIEKAFEIIQTGFLKGANAQGEFLDTLRQYPAQFRDAGLSAEDFLKVSIAAGREGIFSDKGLDVIKEFGLRIREQSTTARDALNSAFGEEFTKKLFANLNNGSVTSGQALGLITKKINETGLSGEKLQTVISDVFGGPGEDVGQRFLVTLGDVLTSTKDLTGAETKLQKQSLELVKVKEISALRNAKLAESTREADLETTKFSEDIRSFLGESLNFLVGAFLSSEVSIGKFNDRLAQSNDLVKENKKLNATPSKTPAQLAKERQEFEESEEKKREAILNNAKKETLLRTQTEAGIEKALDEIKAKRKSIVFGTPEFKKADDEIKRLEKELEKFNPKESGKKSGATFIKSFTAGSLAALQDERNKLQTALSNTVGIEAQKGVAAKLNEVNAQIKTAVDAQNEILGKSDEEKKRIAIDEINQNFKVAQSVISLARSKETTSEDEIENINQRRIVLDNDYNAEVQRINALIALEATGSKEVENLLIERRAAEANYIKGKEGLEKQEKGINDKRVASEKSFYDKINKLQIDGIKDNQEREIAAAKQKGIDDLDNLNKELDLIFASETEKARLRKLLTDKTEQEIKDIQDKYKKEKEEDEEDERRKLREAIANGISEIINFVGVLQKNANDKASEIVLQNIENTEANIEELQAKAEKASGSRKKRIEKDIVAQNELLKRQQAEAEELRIKGAKEEKRIAIIQAIIQGALGISRALASAKIPINFINAAAVGIATGAQIATIAAQPLAEGGVVTGERINRKQNIPTRSNGDNVLAYVKRGEVVLNQRQQSLLGGSPTFRRIGIKGFAEGGMVPPISAPIQALSGNNDLSNFLQVIEAKTDAINNRIDRLQAYVVSDDIARDLAEGNKLKVKATL